jgi:hypothetical protein
VIGLSAGVFLLLAGVYYLHYRKRGAVNKEEGGLNSGSLSEEFLSREGQVALNPVHSNSSIKKY